MDFRSTLPRMRQKGQAGSRCRSISPGRLVENGNFSFSGGVGEGGDIGRRVMSFATGMKKCEVTEVGDAEWLCMCWHPLLMMVSCRLAPRRCPLSLANVMAAHRWHLAAQSQFPPPHPTPSFLPPADLQCEPRLFFFVLGFSVCCSLFKVDPLPHPSGNSLLLRTNLVPRSFAYTKSTACSVSTGSFQEFVFGFKC